MNKKAIIITAVLAIGIGAVILPNINAQTNDADVKVENSSYATPVKVETPVVGQISEHVYSIGHISSDDIYTVSPKIQGEVERINFKVGDSVKKGDILYTLSSSDFRRDKDSNLSQLQSSLDNAKISYDDAKRNYDNALELFNSGSMSQKDLDSSKTMLENSKNNYQSTLEKYKNTADTYSSNGDNYVIKSPTNGVVTKINMSVGMNISNQNYFEIESSGRKIVSVTVSSSEINKIETGQEVQVNVPTVKKKLEGVVREISYSGTNGSYPVTIEIDNDSELYTGMYAEAYISVKESKDAITIPIASLMTDTDGTYFVYVVEGESALKKPVETGLSENGKVEVLSGISSDMKVVTVGKEYIDDSAKVTVSE